MPRGEAWVGLLDGSDICGNTGGNLFQRGGAAIAMDRLANISDVATEERSHRVPSKSAAWGGDLKCHPLLYITCYVDSLPLTYFTQYENLSGVVSCPENSNINTDGLDSVVIGSRGQ